MTQTMIEELDEQSFSTYLADGFIIIQRGDALIKLV